FIELLKEKRQALITHAVTKGVNPNVKMKDSGVEWIGEVPEHWQIRPIKSLASSPTALFIDGDWIESKNLSEIGIRYITTGNVGEGVYKEQGSGYISESTFCQLNCTEVLPGDILISRLNPPIGRACIVPDLGSRIVTSVDNVIFRPDEDFDSRFVVYRFSAKDYFHEMTLMGSGATMQRVSRSELGNVRVAWPPLGEQIEIAKYLQLETKQIDALAERVSYSIDLLKERRSAFITAAVTGKIDLRESP
ncbi:MAG: restriction endonuclease subunit S, partial [Desulfobacter sp.]